ncbi:shikimate dehydrogenase [Sphingomonas humi]|uniref:Shikimate dehydrogenase n=1 Tax=Sphingomonas humi TaxID=335630 RepID=A0ABP7RKB6_9SPHN
MTPEMPYAEVIGDPIGHSKSPLIHKFWLEKLGLEGEYRATKVTPDELGGYFASRRDDPLWRGCNITMPLKLAALAHVAKPQDPSFPVEPVNLAVPLNGRVIGLNTDIHGVMEPLAPLLTNEGMLRPSSAPASRNAVVLGAGGALYPVVWSLLSLGYKAITLVARDRAKVATYLGQRNSVTIRYLAWGDPLPPSDLLVNATPLGMTGYPDLPYDASSIAGDGVVFELVYRPLETTLLRDARQRRLQIVDGLQMLVGQAAPSFARFFGKAAPRDFDSELRALLTQ